MIILSLYESLKNAINETKTLRTIDKKLWLSIASACSRNRSNEAEFIKPSKSATKELLLPRYIAAIIIMKKKCPTSLLDIEDIKTFKLVGLRLILLGCTFNEIKQEYIANGGTLVSEELPVSAELETTELELEIKLDPLKQVDEPTVKQEEPKIVKLLPEGIKTYEDMVTYVKDTYDSIDVIARDLYNILDTTYYKIRKSFYKLLKGKYKVFFKDVYTREEQKLYHSDQHCIYVTWVKIYKSKVIEGTFCIVVNDMTINSLPLSSLEKIDDDIIITRLELYNILETALSKLLFVSLVEYNNIKFPGLKKEIKQSFGNFENKPRSFDDDMDSNEFAKIFKMVLKKYKTPSQCADMLNILLTKEHLGNTGHGLNIELSYPIFTSKFTRGAHKLFHIIGFMYDKSPQFIIKVPKDNLLLTSYGWSWVHNDDYDDYIDWTHKDTDMYIKVSDMHIAYQAVLATVFYYANNYSNLI